MGKPWVEINIEECGEPFCAIPASVLRVNPHPYISLGAPYGKCSDPFWLREGVVNRLINAETYLKIKASDYRLTVFDAWRPLSVQAFMFELAIKQECQARGIAAIDLCKPFEREEIFNVVKRFWAFPSNDPSSPPPHSTGGAIDITISDLQGKPIDMGGEIDDISSVSEPDYYLAKAKLDSFSKEYLWNSRRSLLADVMKEAGFVQHPNEWWHFSYGDQLWAWLRQSPFALYGASSPSPSSLKTS